MFCIFGFLYNIFWIFLWICLYFFVNFVFLSEIFWSHTAWASEAVTCEIPFSTFETRSRFLPPYHVVRDRDRDFYLPIMWFEIEIFEIEIFHHWISCFETRSRFFIIESRSSRRDREFSSLNLEIRDEIEMLFISFVNKFQTPEQRAENDISLKKMCIQR